MELTQKDDERVLALLEHAAKAGADAAEASLSIGESLSASVRLGALEGVEREESRSIALRAFIGKRQAAAAVTDLRPESLKALAERVVAMARLAPEDPYCGLLDAAYLTRDIPELERADTARPSAEALEEAARACEAAALAQAGVTNSAGASAGFDVGGRIIATSHGFFGRATGTSYSVGAQPLAEKDGAKERDYEYRSARFFADLPDPAAIGAVAGARAAARLGARKITSRTAAVIFENRLAGRLIGPFLGAITGSAVARGVSFLKDKLGKPVFSERFEIREDPFRRRGLSSRAFDGEGGAVRAIALVDGGRPTTWLLNAASARQLGMPPSGHATAGHGGPPGAGASNLIVTPGNRSLEALMADAGEGLLVTEMFSPALNANTGDWSVGVAGFWFEKGERAYPVSEVTVAGNLIDIYARLVPGADSDVRGGLEAPSLFVDGLAIGGA